jgi:peptide deformylase
MLPILTYPDSALKEVSAPVETVDDALRSLIDEMLATMYQAPGIGLAAPQVGRRIRLVVMDVPLDEDSRTGPLALINPRIVRQEGQIINEEGCLSLPGLRCEVERASRVVVEALDRNGKPFVIEGSDLLAICLQHEIDHLDGRLFLDYISPLKRALYRKRRKKELQA